LIGSVLRVRYEITAALGDTPMFQVYAAKDRLQAREVCVRLLKEPFADEPEFISKLQEVTKNLQGIQHPHLERFLEMEAEEGTAFLVTELSKGTVLRERLRKLGTLSVPVAVSSAIVICEAIQALHTENRVHGDIGSHNVVINADGDTKVQLYGTWQAYAFSQSAGHAALPDMAAYLAPEISRGAMPSAASDVYGIGVLLYEMLAGRQPFIADTPVAVALKHLNEGVPNVRMMNPSVPIVLAEIVKKAMSKEPVTRYIDAGDLLADLRILQDALRFGRTLAWPLRESRTAPITPIVAEKPKVAPTMSATRETAKPAKEPKPSKPAKEPRGRRVEVATAGAPRVLIEKEAPDVPVWVKTLIAFFAGLLAVLVVIYVVFNLNKPKMVEVPALKRLTFSEATSRLDELKLKARVQRRETDENVPAEQVLRSSPAGGEKVFEGSTVNLVVSLGSAMVEIPDLKGVNVDEATRILTSIGLETDPSVEQVASAQVGKGLILDQQPPKGKKVQRGSTVKVKISAGELTSRERREMNTRYNYRLEIGLEDITTKVRLRIDMVDARETRTIYEKEHEPGDRFPVIASGYGKKVTFKFYYDGEWVKDQEATVDEEPADENQ
jgi:eukaryotic-like serine/threonine-protein kinase